MMILKKGYNHKHLQTLIEEGIRKFEMARAQSNKEKLQQKIVRP